MKKLTLIVSAIALLIGFSQCKKEDITPNNSNEGVFITLTAGYGQQDTKTVFNPTDGSFIWSTGYEYINVGGSTSGYLGQLSSSAYGAQTSTRTFSGTLGKAPVENETLYFFYLGKGNHAGATTVDFSSQDGTSANVTKCHIAIGSATYDGTSNYSATLNMAMAIAYFDLSGFGAGNIYLNGNDVYSTATINYTTGTIEGNSKGYINLGTAGSKYVALIPSVETETTLNFNSSSKTGSMKFNNGIKTGYYYTGDSYSALTVSAETGTGIPGTFSVSATKQVFFSKGNLQYQASTNTWRFAEHQYDYVGDETNGNVYVGEVKSNNANIASDYTGWIDLFGWGTSGYNDKYPYMTSTNESDYIAQSLTGTYANYDWGVNNYTNIINGDGYTTWRTLTKDEWIWIIGPSTGDITPGTNCRLTTTSGLTGTDNDKARFVMATVNNVPGMIIFPDNYSHPSTAYVSYNSPTYNGKIQYNKFVVDELNWNIMADAGAIFLPASGYRNGTSITYNSTGSYMSSTKQGVGPGGINYLYFTSGNFNPARNYTDAYYYYGRSVRLVRE